MVDITQLLANGAQTNADFPGIGQLPDAYYKGRDQAYQQAGRDLFKNGVPTTPDGQPDFAAMGKALFQHGDIGQGVAASNLDLQRQGIQQNREGANFVATGGSAPQPNIVSPPSSSRNASVPVAPALNKGGAQNQPQGPQGGTLMQVLAAQGIPNNQLGAATASVARQLGLEDPNQPLDLQDPQVRNVLVPAIQQLKRGGIGQVQPPQPGDNPPQGQPQAAQPGSTAPMVPTPVAAQRIQPQPSPQPQQPPQAQPSPFANAQASGLIPAGVDPVRYVAGLKYRAAALPKGPAQELMQSQVNAIDKATELTSEQRDYSAAAGNPKLNDFTAQKLADAERAKGIASSDIKERDAIIASGSAAKNRLITLNTISNIVDGDKNMTLGFGADTALKVKMALESIGINVGDLSGPQAIQKLNAQLASESTKAISPRPAQFEFRTFLGNNPGLSLDKAGNQRVIGIFSQLAKRDIELGKLARKNGDNWKNWDNVVENYDKKKENQIHDPATGKIITTDSIVAPGPSKANGTAPPAPASIASKGDYDKLASGATFTGPDGKKWRKP